MSPRHGAVGARHLAQRRRPIAGLLERIGDLPIKPLGHGAEEPFLAADVMVERHRLDTEGRAKLAHAEPIEPGSIDQIERGIDNALEREG